MCRSGAVWGLWGAGLGAFGSVGQRWWSIEFDQSISDWLGRRVCHHPHVAGVRRGGGGAVCRASRCLGGEGGGKRRRHVLDSARALAVEVSGDGGGLGRWCRSSGISIPPWMARA